MQEYIQQVEEIAQQAQQQFGSLTAAQLNWKPSPEQWSIAQCLDHLVVSDNTYNARFDKIISKTYTPSLWTKISPFSKFFGRYLVKNAGAVVKKKMKRPPVFKPSDSEVDAGIVSRFVAHVGTLADYFRKLSGNDTQKIKITSPVSGLITYSIADTIALLAGHEQRHFNQAMKVLQHPNFPR